MVAFHNGDASALALAILAQYRRATPSVRREGRAWYPAASRAARAIAADAGISRAAACGIVAALSPRQQWVTNIAQARRIALADASGVCPSVGLGDACGKAWRIRTGEAPLAALGGPKVRAFYRNISGDRRSVTCDVWALRAADWSAVGSKRAAPTTKQYPILERAYQLAADSVGETPRAMQAIVWTIVRGKAS